MSGACAANPVERQRSKFRRLAMGEGLEPRVLPDGSVLELLLGGPLLAPLLDSFWAGNNNSCAAQELSGVPLRHGDPATEFRRGLTETDAVGQDMRSLLQIVPADEPRTVVVLETARNPVAKATDAIMATATDLNAGNLDSSLEWVDQLLASITHTQKSPSAQAHDQPVSDGQDGGSSGAGTGTVAHENSAAPEASPTTTRKGDASVTKDSKTNVSAGGGSRGKAIHPPATARSSTHAGSAAVKAAHAGAHLAAGKAVPVGGALPVEGDTASGTAALDYGGYPPMPPTANDDSYMTMHDSPVSVAAPGVLENDYYDPSSTSVSLVSGPSHSSSFNFNTADGSFSYTPQYHFVGTDTFVYQLDSGGYTDSATVSIGVMNNAPVAADDSYQTGHDTQLIVSAPGVKTNDYDPDGDPFTPSLVAGPSHAANFVFNSDGSFSYLPLYHYVGTDSFTYKVNDGIVDGNTATVTIGVFDNPPVANNDGPFTTYYPTPVEVAAPGVLGNDYDPDGDAPLTAVIGTGPSHGILDYFNSDGSFKYEPDINYTGSDSFTYFANDGIMLSASPATVSINVLAKADLDIDGFTETTEDTIGGLVVVNTDGNNAPRKEIILQMQPPTVDGNVTLSRSGTGGVRVFTASTGGTEITFNGTDNVFAVSSLPLSLYVEGSSASSMMRDITLTLAPQGPGGSDSVKFTVLWVNPVDVAFSGNASSDNDKSDAYKSWTVANTYALAGPQLYNATYGARMGWGTEARGLVQPPDFSYSGVNLRTDRDFEYHDWIGNGASTIDQGSFSASIPPGNDGHNDVLRDNNPTDSDPPGQIFDLDAPGLNLSTAPASEIHRTRMNFKEFAEVTIDGNLIRASLVYQYFVRFSMRQTASPSGNTWVAVDPPDVQGDLQAGPGTTSLSWNLQ